MIHSVVESLVAVSFVLFLGGGLYSGKLQFQGNQWDMLLNGSRFVEKTFN